MLSIIGILILASLLVWFKKLKQPNKDFNELYLRIRSWWWMIGLLFTALIAGETATIIFIAFISFLALKEFFSIIPTRQADRRVLFWAYASIPVQYYWVASGWYGMFIIFIPVYVFLFLPMRMVLIGETKGFVKSAGSVHWVTMLTVYSISHIAYFIVLEEKNTLAGTIGMVLFLLIMTQLNDISQYVWGKSFGKHKIIPKVSPNKTWEGFFGGMFTIVLVSSFIAPLLTPLNMIEGIILGLIISIAGFIGDVVISAVKRDLEIKDSGNLIPGHGGILDRLDSLTYTSPLVFHYIYYLYY
jgi:phosphatidate cytidylyltransferase